MVNLSVPSLNDVQKGAFIHAVASSMGLNSSCVTILDNHHNGSRLSKNGMLAISYVVVERTLTEVGWDSFAHHFSTSADLLKNLSQSLPLAVYSGRATYYFQRKLRLLGYQDAVLPRIVAVYSGSIPTPTALPSIIPVVSNDNNSPSINATLISGLVAGFFAFFCVCIPILYLTRRRYMEKWAKKTGSDMFFYDIFAPKEDVVGLNKMAILKQLKTREEFERERGASPGGPTAGADIASNSPLSFNDFNSIFETEKSRSMWSRKSSLGDDAFNDWVNSLKINEAASSGSSECDQVCNTSSVVVVDLINRSRSDTIVYEDIYTSDNLDIAPTWNMASEKAAAQSGLKQNIQIQNSRDVHEPKNFPMFALSAKLLGVKSEYGSDKGSDVDITEIYPDYENQYALSAAESVFIAQSYTYTKEKEIMRKTELQLKFQGSDDVNNMMVEMADIYPDADKIFLPELSSNGDDTNVPVVHSTPVEIRKMKTAIPQREGMIHRYSIATYHDSDHCPLTEAMRQTLPVYDVDEVAAAENVQIQHFAEGNYLKSVDSPSLPKVKTLDSKSAHFKRDPCEVGDGGYCSDDDDGDEDIMAQDMSRSFNDLWLKSGRAVASTYSASEDFLANKSSIDEYDDAENSAFHSTVGRRYSSFTSPQVGNLSWRQTFSANDSAESGVQGVYAEADDIQSEVHIRHQRLFENMRLSYDSIPNVTFSADKLKRVVSAEEPMMSGPVAVPENFEQAPIHSAKFRAIKMKFETMIQRNTKLTASSSFTLSPPQQAATIQQHLPQFHKRCRSDDSIL